MLMLPLPTTVDTTAIPDTTDTAADTVDTTVDITDTPMADTDMLTTTASVPLMLNPRLRLKPIPLTCMLATTAMPATPMVPTATLMVPTTATPQLPLPATNTFPLPLPLMASTNSTNVRPRLPPRLMPTMVDTTATPDTTDTADTDMSTTDITDIPMPDTDTVILASVPLMLNPQSPALTVAHKVSVDSTDSPMPVMPPLPTMAFPTTVKLNEQLLLARTSDYDDLKSFGFVTTR